MQTSSLDPKFLMKSLQPMSALPATQTNPIPLPLITTEPVTAGPAMQQPVRESAQVGPFAEMDAMLARDPNTGAVNGLRFALLFNAGIALSGLVIWELWTMLAA